MSDDKDIDVVLFDVGGVIVQMTDIATLGPFNGLSDGASIRSLWLDCPNVAMHERGEIDAVEFAKRMVEKYAIGCSVDDFLARCIAWHGDVFAGVDEVLAEIQPSVRVGCLSNTCDYHWRNMRCASRVHALFETQFLSFRMGALKPEPEIYGTVAEQLGCAPSRILFFDDTERNIVGARAVGYHAHRVDGIDDARRVLGDYGLLRGGTRSSGST